MKKIKDFEKSMDDTTDRICKTMDKSHESLQQMNRWLKALFIVLILGCISMIVMNIYFTYKTNQIIETWKNTEKWLDLSK